MSNDVSALPAATLPRLGLYFPFIHFRDEDWVKVAALYWPKLARVVPAGYPTHDSDAVRALSAELDWTLDLSPDEARDAAASTFMEFLDVIETELNVDAADHNAYLIGVGGRPSSWDVAVWSPGDVYDRDLATAEAQSPPQWGSGPGRPPFWGSRGDDRVAGVLAAELEPRLCQRLSDLGLLGDARYAWYAPLRRSHAGSRKRTGENRIEQQPAHAVARAGRSFQSRQPQTATVAGW